MFQSNIDLEKVKNNEIKSVFYLQNRNFKAAEKLLLENVYKNTSSCFTYNLLIKIYFENNNYPLLLKILNSAIINTSKKSLYKKLKKQLILNKFISELKSEL